jgi:hypothetical protein
VAVLRIEPFLSSGSEADLATCSTCREVALRLERCIDKTLDATMDEEEPLFF